MEIATRWIQKQYLETHSRGVDCLTIWAFLGFFQNIPKMPILCGYFHHLGCVSKYFFCIHIEAISIGYVVVYSIFSVGAVFKEKFASQNCLNYDFSKMLKFPKMLGYFSIFLGHNVYNFFLILSVPWQFLTRRKMSHAILIKNECVRSSRVQAIWWHSPSRDSRPGEFQPYGGHCHDLKMSELCILWILP